MQNLKSFYRLPPGLIRTVLATTVVIHHLSSISLGHWAVYSFFILSGYWVSALYSDKFCGRRFGAPIFYLSRYLRLLPLFVVCQLLICSLVVLGVIRLAGLSLLPWFLKDLAIVGLQTRPVLLVPAWSIDIEMQFYLAVPVVLILLQAVSARLRPVLCIVAALALCCASPHFNGIWLPHFLGLFLIGVGFAQSQYSFSDRSKLAGALVFAAIFVGVCASPALRPILIAGSHPRDPQLFATWNPVVSTLLAFASAPVVLGSVRIRSTRADRQLGDFAYSLYLFHWIPMIVLLNFFAHSVPTIILKTIDLPIAFGGSWLLFKLIDRPCESYRRALTDRLLSRAPGIDSARVGTDRAVVNPGPDPERGGEDGEGSVAQGGDTVRA